jgi:microcystin-dependent protein
MADPFIGEVRLMSFSFAPRGWAFANGQILPIAQNQALFSLYGTTYGGNGQTTFALPDLRGRVPIHEGPGFALGQIQGEQSHTLLTSEVPAHNHMIKATNLEADSATPPPNGQLASYAASPCYISPPANLTTMADTMFSTITGGQPHQNMQPYLVLNFCVALQGIFPSRN